ncbi:hypothetical protein Pst134EA_017398 [Puccinia striiformis f. sp. tritici]|nr:hypothetical protein Pst134EA_017398 [Puccinia striiformis f. sp. tritici]KAH9461089.1 hypothetical protein Pst134EA_017398 [Puccinia striiformis f. sp. tritici]
MLLCSCILRLKVIQHSPVHRNRPTNSKSNVSSNKSSQTIQVIMSPLIFSFPQDYGYVTLAAASTGFLGLFQTLAVGKARKAAKVPYPNAYVSHEEAIGDPAKMKFNCAQRAHANTLESLPFFLFSLLFTGLRHPRFAASCGALWVVGRFVYTLGYNTGDPSKRARGVFHNFGTLGLLVGSTWVSLQMVMETF